MTEMSPEYSQHAVTNFISAKVMAEACMLGAKSREEIAALHGVLLDADALISRYQKEIFLKGKAIN